ncbi:DUF4232 domain-containing protein [Streptomyces sp. NPDC057540]|uniref:DUF4232 domain-containing protein n=1 Tax=Streptomyces sp. NPDC057540 TaxID=3346160 RepID=UPI0036B85D77
MHTALSAWKTYVLGGVALAALVASTGCQASDEAKGTGTPAPSATSATSVSDPPSASSTTPPADGGTSAPATTSARPPATASPTASGDAGGSAGQGSGSGGKTTRACTDDNLAVTAKAEPHDSLRHLTLTATNIGDRTCTLYKYALIRFDEGSYDEVGPLESNWHAVATLAPGEKAYAGMRLFVAGEETRAVQTLTLGFQGRDSADEIGSPIDVPLPDGSPFLNIGPTPGVTFWDTDLKSVQKYTFAR